MRGRGLKPVPILITEALAMSPPMRGRGLKHVSGVPVVQKLKVAPHAGAWIETSLADRRWIGTPVAPHAGAWIETRLSG